jgi:hypothetical protein
MGRDGGRVLLEADEADGDQIGSRFVALDKRNVKRTKEKGA